jgi:outer membrane receptor for ferric coprogen and ferric-rhodotorulic acid
MALYDRIEVLKGSTGLLTGSGEPGATINLIRKKPTAGFAGHATVGIGSDDDYRGEIDVGGALNESGSVRARAVAAYQDTASNLDRYKRETQVFYGILEVDLTPQTLLTIGGDTQDSTPTASTWGGIPLLDLNGNFNDRPRSFNNGTNWSHWDQYTRTGFATLEHSFSNGWTAKLQLNHQINGYDANLGAAASGFPNPADGTGVSMWVGQYIGRTTSDAVDAYASGPFSLGGREHELVVGASASRRVWRNAGWWNLPDYDFDVHGYYQWNGAVPRPQWGATPDYTNDETTREEGFYAAVRWNLHDTTKLITGGRFSNYRNREQDLDASGEFVPYVGIVQDLGKNYSAYASYTSIFSPQSLQDEQGRTLAPLEGNNMEIGIKAEYFDGRLNASAAVFRLEQDNFGIESGGLTPTGGIAYRAAQGVKTEGWEIEASGQILPGWQVQGGYSHHVSRQQGERVTTLTPSNSLTLYTSYSPQQTLKGLTFGGGARWQDETWGNISTPDGGSVKHTVDGYWVLDAMARYRFNDNLSAALNINNLLDKKYYTIFSWYSTYTWGAPRSVDLNVTYRF